MVYSDIEYYSKGNTVSLYCYKGSMVYSDIEYYSKGKTVSLYCYKGNVCEKIMYMYMYVITSGNSPFPASPKYVWNVY